MPSDSAAPNINQHSFLAYNALQAQKNRVNTDKPYVQPFINMKPGRGRQMARQSISAERSVPKIKASEIF